MSTQPYHHGNLRAALVDTAVELARTTGPEGIVLREVARRAGVSHSAAYRHFSDRAALLAEVAAYGMTGLENAMRKEMAGIRENDPARRAVARLRATGRAYVDYAVLEPGLFAVAFAASKEGGPQGGDPYHLLNDVLDELVTTGAMPEGRREGSDAACWSMVHGYADLHVHGPLREVSKDERDRTLEKLLDLMEIALTRP